MSDPVMTRRVFLSAAGVLPLASQGGGEVDRRRIERWNEGRWEPVQMRDVKAGWRFRADDVQGEFIAQGDAFPDDCPGRDGLWCVTAEFLPAGVAP